MTELIYHTEFKRICDLYKLASYIELLKSAVEFENQLNEAKITLFKRVSEIVFQLNSKSLNQIEQKINPVNPEQSSTLSEEPQKSEQTKGLERNIEYSLNYSNYSSQNLNSKQKIGTYMFI